jgi:omega-6 fatty acid desaturase (delta-12 desaturase)
MDRQQLHKIIRPFIKPSAKKALWQIINTLLPYFVLIIIMYLMISNGIHWLFTIPLSFVAGLFLVRVFIFFHDCTHHSFLQSKKAMSILGHLFGVLVFTPYYKWQRTHKEHHKTVGNLDLRGEGDVWTMTVEEYQNASTWKKIGYKLYRNPFILFLIGPMYLFVIHERLPIGLKTKKDWFSYIFTNLAIAAIIYTVTVTIGFQYYLMIQMPIIFFASTLGVWMFFVQHQYEDVYWENKENWDVIDAALKGSSVYKLPLVLDWFTGSIGYHNLHHVNARIPNYQLKKAFMSHKLFMKSRTISIWTSFKLSLLTLYDQKAKRLITFRQYKKLKYQ